MEKLTDPEFIKALAALATALSWPLLVVVLVWLGRRRIGALVESLESLTLPGGFEAKLRREVNKEIRADDESATARLPTERQFEAAERIGKFALDADLSVIRKQVVNFALEYERIRATMNAGDERTRRMEVVASKMRTLAIAANPLLEELSNSRSPGQRLAAVVFLQVKSDSQYFDWLAERFSVEQPFIGYHAAVALLTAARNSSEHERPKVLAAIQIAKERLGSGKETTDRFRVLDSAEREVVKA